MAKNTVSQVVASLVGGGRNSSALVQPLLTLRFDYFAHICKNYARRKVSAK